MISLFHCILLSLFPQKTSSTTLSSVHFKSLCKYEIFLQKCLHAVFKIALCFMRIVVSFHLAIIVLCISR